MKDSKKMFRTKTIRNSAKAIIIQDGAILLQRCDFGDGKICYLLPGGGQKFEETLKEACRRECLEETGADVEVGELMWMREYISKNHEFAHEKQVHALNFYFRCRLLSPINAANASEPDPVQIGVDWIPLNRLKEITLYPKIIQELIDAEGNISVSVYGGDVN